MACRFTIALQNCRSCRVFLVCSGYHLPKVILGMTTGEPATGSLMIIGTERLPHSPIPQKSYCRTNWLKKFMLVLLKDFRTHPAMWLLHMGALQWRYWDDKLCSPTFDQLTMFHFQILLGCPIHCTSVCFKLIVVNFISILLSNYSQQCNSPPLQTRKDWLCQWMNLDKFSLVIELE